MTEPLTGTFPVPGSGVPDALREPGRSRGEERDYSRTSSRMGRTSIGTSSAVHG